MPDRFCSLLDEILEKAQLQWAVAELGVRWGCRGDRRLTHVVWADNVWLLAQSMRAYQGMSEILTIELDKAGLKWELESLEVMPIRPELDTQDTARVWSDTWNETMQYKVVTKLGVL